jgi:hypothetical protein
LGQFAHRLPLVKDRLGVLIHFVFQVIAVNFQPQAFGALKTGKVTGFGNGFGGQKTPQRNYEF